MGIEWLQIVTWLEVLYQSILGLLNIGLWTVDEVTLDYWDHSLTMNI